MRSLIAVPLVAALAVALPAQAQDFPGDPAAGEIYARQACSGCHLMPRQEWSEQTALSFAEIAAQPHVTGMSLLAWLTSTPHPTMPNLIIPERQAKDVVAYILDLGGR